MGLIDYFKTSKAPKIITKDFEFVAKSPTLLKKLRSLTLHAGSGLNIELDHLTESSKTRNVDAKVLLAFYDRELVAWALLSREKSNFLFPKTYTKYNPNKGTLFEVFVNPKFRKRGIGGALLKEARQKASPMQLCVAPWDYKSTRFYQNYSHFDNIEL